MWEWRVGEDRVRWSELMGPLFGLERGASPETYGAYLELLHPEDRPNLQEDVRLALETGRDYERDFRTVWPDGTVRWLYSRAHAVKDETGAVVSIVGIARDMTERRRGEVAARFLSRAGSVLAELLAVEPMLERVADLAVPELADWCSVHLAGEQGEITQVAVAHQDPARVELAREYNKRFPTDPSAPTGVPAVIRGGPSELYPGITDEMLVAAEMPAEQLEYVRELQLRSVIIVPMPARGRVLGAITFVAAESGREFTTADVELAEELGRRAGLAIDNVRLFEQAQGTAETLQRSLLPDRLPELDNLESAARYLPGMSGAEVGGDWYDVFELPSGATAIVVGDVMGRGIAAAALMGQLRTAVRTYALIAADPGEAMTLTAEYVAARGDVDFATALLLTLDGDGRTLQACSAGHLMPVVLPPSGAASLADIRQGPPLGIVGHRYSSSVLTLEPGGSLLLYTDGLVERRRIALDKALERLLEVATEAPREPEGLVDHVLAELLAGKTDDDVAVLAVRSLAAS